jgi:hypothetical protein
VINNAHLARMADALCQLELSQDRSRYLILRFDEILLLWLFGFRYRSPPCSDLAVSAPQVANVREVPISVANTFWLCEQYRSERWGRQRAVRDTSALPVTPFGDGELGRVAAFEVEKKRAVMHYCHCASSRLAKSKLLLI